MSPSLCPAALFRIALCGDASCCVSLPSISLSFSLSFSCSLFSHPPTTPTQLARLFIKTSKLTGFNRVRFTAFCCLGILFITTTTVLLHLRVPATSASRSLILSRKSRPSNPHPPASSPSLAVRFHPPLFHFLARSHSTSSFFSVPFTPSAEYRSTPRNVVLAFARVPFYPSA